MKSRLAMCLAVVLAGVAVGVVGRQPGPLIAGSSTGSARYPAPRTGRLPGRLRARSATRLRCDRELRPDGGQAAQPRGVLQRLGAAV